MTATSDRTPHVVNEVVRELLFGAFGWSVALSCACSEATSASSVAMRASCRFVAALVLGIELYWPALRVTRRLFRVTCNHGLRLPLERSFVSLIFLERNSST